MNEAVDIETLALTPEQLASFHRMYFLSGTAGVTVPGLRRHAVRFGPYLVAEVAAMFGLTSPVGYVKAPKPPPARRRR